LVCLRCESAIDVRIKSSAEFLTFLLTKGYSLTNQIRIIGGNSKGWDASTDMTYNATAVLSISGLTTGELKFRLDNSWLLTLVMMEINLP
jgi:hypothetical protein